MTSKLKKVGIIIDSGSSIKGKKPKNLVVVPLIVNEIINGETLSYNDGVDLNREEIYKKIGDNAKLSTSQAIFGECLKTLENMLKEYDEILVFPLSKGLSGTYNTWTQVIEEFQGKKIYLFDSLDVGTGNYWAAMESYNKYINGSTPEEIQKYLDDRVKRREAVIIINDLDILIRGGRISSFKGKIAKFLNLKILVSFNGSLDVIDKTSNIELAVSKSLKKIDSNIKFVKKGIKNIVLVFNNLDANDPAFQEYKKLIENWLENNKVEGREKLVTDFLPSVISVHTGINTLTVWIEANE